MTPDRTHGRVVWHDLHTHDVGGSRRFYQALFGWSYTVEHSTDFVWAEGEADYTLITHAGQAHGGIVGISPAHPARWLAFVTVEDVDRATRHAKAIGGHVEKPPFDIPGVGRCSVLHDPDGAAICPFVARHDYAAPESVFVGDLLPGKNRAGSAGFYEDLFNWRAPASGAGPASDSIFIATAKNAPIAIALPPHQLKIARGGWLPLIATQDPTACVAQACSLGATLALPVTRIEAIGDLAVITDPAGASFGILRSR